MSNRVLVDVAWDGTAEYIHFDADGNPEAIEWSNDIGDILDNNMNLRNDGSNGYGASREWKRLAEVPVALVRKWESELGVAPNFLLTQEGFPALIAKIKDRDNCRVRTDK